MIGTDDTARVFKIFGLLINLLMASLLFSIVAAEIFVALSTVLWIVLMNRGWKYRMTGIEVPVLGFILVRILAIIFSQYPTLSLITIWRELLLYVTIFFFIFYFQHASRQQTNSLFRWLIVSTAIITIIACTKFVFGYVPRANGLSGGGTLSTHLALVIVLTLMIKNDRKIFLHAIYPWILLIIFGCGMACTLTRGDAIATVASISVYGLVFNRRFLVGFVIFALVIIFVIPTFRHRFATLADPMNNSSDRIELWKDAWRQAGVHPLLGFGPETFRMAFKSRDLISDKNIDAWHNDIIHLYMESGILGIISYLVLFGFYWTYAFRLVRHQSQFMHGVDAGWLGVLLLLTYLIIGCFGTPTFSITNGILFRFLIAMIAVEYQRLREQTII